MVMPPWACRADDAASAKSAKQAARAKWESVIIWFGDEETGEWSLRIRDTDVKERASFEYLELWQFSRADRKWVPIKVEKFRKSITLPKLKGADEPEDSQTLVELKEIEPKTAGLWYAKWKIDDIECGTLMRVGTGRTENKLSGKPPGGTIPMAVPINLDKSEAMFVPDPKSYCVAGGAGKPEEKPAAAPSADEKKPEETK
jgi:hypothetical protein